MTAERGGRSASNDAPTPRCSDGWCGPWRGTTRSGYMCVDCGNPRDWSNPAHHSYGPIGLIPPAVDH